MINIIIATLKGIFRDRVFQGIIALAVLFLFIPSAASLTMRQVTELSITLSLSLISFISLLLSVFLGSTSIWRDIERRYTYSVLSLPISRAEYIIGRFLGLSIFLIFTSLLLGIVACVVIKISYGIYPPDRMIDWGIITIAIIFSTLKYVILIAVSLVLSTVSTSFFLPIFSTICIYLAGCSTQHVYEYINTAGTADKFTPLFKTLVAFIYYILPNLSAFDLNINAIYSIHLNYNGLLMTLAYFVLYTSILLCISILVFNRREMK